MDSVPLGGLVEGYKIGIVGYGNVGQAIAWSHREDRVIYHDPKHNNSRPIEDIRNCDAIYICVPSPPAKDGSCDTTLLEQTLKDLWFANIKDKQPILLSMTTAPPGTYQRLQELYPNLVHYPAFFQERHGAAGYANTPFQVYGGDPAHCIRAKNFVDRVNPVGHNKHIVTDIQTAALYKYFSNSYLATKVSIANEWNQLATHLGVDWHLIKCIADIDDRVGANHLDVPGYDNLPGWGGSCFPKDTKAIIQEAAKIGVNLPLLQTVVNFNKQQRNNDQSI